MNHVNTIQRPAWLRKKIDLSSCVHVKNMLRDLKLETVCEQALCPNIGECFGNSQATFLIMGKICTRHCSFCNLQKGTPAPLDRKEPGRIAEAVKRLALKHVVITSVTRDDLSDGGASHFVNTLQTIKKTVSQITIELLIPDFMFNQQALSQIAAANPDIVGHNLETVPRLYPKARQAGDYQRSLGLLSFLKGIWSTGRTKSGIMLGLGETESEVLAVFDDLRASACDFLSIGQYLSPSRSHYPVQEHIAPEHFDFFKTEALKRGFLHVESSSYTRSSYSAAEYLKKD